MKRRLFLKSAAAIAPVAGFPSFLLSHAADSTSEGEIHVVPAGEDRYGESHSRGYSRILFKVMPKEEATHAQIAQGVVYVFSDGTMARYA